MATRQKKEKEKTPPVESKEKKKDTPSKDPEVANPHEGDSSTMGWKLAKVLGEIHTIPKEGYNPHFEYHYVKEDTLTEHIRPLLAKWGMSLVFGAERIEDLATGDDRGTWTRVWCRFTLFDCDGHEFSVLCPGEGTDAKHPDKALYKAMTGATKYFLYKTFLVSTGDDPERDDDPNSTTPPKGGKKKQSAKKNTQTPQTQDANTPDMMTSDQLEELEKFQKNQDNFSEQLVKVLDDILKRGGTEGSAGRIIAECKRQNKDVEDKEKQEEKTPGETPQEPDEEVPF